MRGFHPVAPLVKGAFMSEETGKRLETYEKALKVGR